MAPRPAPRPAPKAVARANPRKPHNSCCPPNFSDAKTKFDNLIVPCKTPTNIIGQTYVVSGFLAGAALPLSKLSSALDMTKIKGQIRAPRKVPSDETAMIWKLLKERSFEHRDAKGGRILSWRGVEKLKAEKILREKLAAKEPVPRQVNYQLLAKFKDHSVPSDSAMYMIKNVGKKTLWQFTGSPTVITTIGVQDSIPALPLFLPNTRSHEVVGPFRRSALLMARKCAKRDRLIHHALAREFGRKSRKGEIMTSKRMHAVPKEGETYSYQRRFKNYHKGSFVQRKSKLSIDSYSERVFYGGKSNLGVKSNPKWGVELGKSKLSGELEEEEEEKEQVEKVEKGGMRLEKGAGRRNRGGVCAGCMVM